jgi:bifunctional oligoribonuclease and PAP phosphatase NrnA
MPIDWSPFVDLVRRHRRFLLTTHIRPDGDGLGSILALGEVLRLQGKEVRLVIPSSLPYRYAFLDPEKRIEVFSPHPPPIPSPTSGGRAGREGEGKDAWRNAEVVIVLDTGTWNQMGEFGPFLRELSAVKVVIDHHQTQDDLGAIRFVDVTAEATGRLAHQAITALGSPLTTTAAEALLVALAMDTGWFRHGNTSAETLHLAGELIHAGARPDYLYDQLFENNSLPRLKLLGLMLDRIQIAHGGQVSYSEIRVTDYVAVGATPQDTEDLVNYMRSVAGVEVGLLFMEQLKGGVKVSFRSRARVDVAHLAERFGGGGHRRAAGAIVQATLEETRSRVLEAVAAALDSSP